MSLEDKLRAAAEKGVTHISLFSVPRHGDPKKFYWAARATPSTGHHYVSSNSEDPVEALAKVLDDLPKAKRRDAKPDLITATVTPEDKDGW